MSIRSGRRRVMGQTLASAATLALSPARWAFPAPQVQEGAGPFRIALDPWSLRHDLVFEREDHEPYAPLDYPRLARELGFDAVFHDNLHFPGKLPDMSYVRQMRSRCDDAGVRSEVFMLGVLGGLASAEGAERTKAVERHVRWAEAAKHLGCRAIRVVCANMPTELTRSDRMAYAAESMHALAERVAVFDMDTDIENHGSWSSDPTWLAGVLNVVDHPRCGLMPDFNEWGIHQPPLETWEDRYQALEIMRPHVKAVCASMFEFDERGHAVRTDVHRAMKILVDAGFDGPVGVEFLGLGLGEREGVVLGRKLLEGVQRRLAGATASRPCRAREASLKPRRPAIDRRARPSAPAG